MSLAIGAPVLSNVQATSLLITTPAATGGTGPYTYAFYRSTVSGFSAGSGNIIRATTAPPAGLTFQDTGLTPGTIYYYKTIVTDTGNSDATATSSNGTATTGAMSLSQNQFSQSPFLGTVDQALDYNTLAVQIDASQSGALVAGAAVKYATTAGGLPKVVGCTAASDAAIGFLNFSIKDQSFPAGKAASVSSQGNVIYLYAALAINRGQMVTSLPAGTVGGCNGGVVPATGSSGFPIVGQAMDTVAIGQLCRIQIIAPLPFLDS